ncbi:MobQ family relaxase [Jeotgalibacillus proteolyticus]|uniref:MobA/MobL protein domain-containing protein n=1 Tax=Jeotgalibacillus proteolyticus TaxID=2082395 RepID=A0A2S5G8V2_9BACL|nr:MobQ family relaxase [Jeotgalibacillus proteolyticus]PPA69409.1 hypothetical protein C4B60_16615 [Jeotgalibacillus proteolyticus]
MAPYHFSVQVLSRSNGQSAVASAAHRSGERLLDQRSGEIKIYRRTLQPETMIISPLHAPEWVQNRSRLWNEVENSETRKNSQLAREIKMTLPLELSEVQQTDLVKDFVRTEVVRNGMIADIAIHRENPKNPHAHILLTTREISKDGFTVKNRDWNDRALLMQWRKKWAALIKLAFQKQH